MLPATWSIEADKGTGIPIITVKGRLTFEGCKQLLQDIREAPAYQNSNKSLWDLSQVVEFPSTSEIRDFALLARDPETKPRVTAFVAARDVDFGLTRMFEMLLEQPGVDRRVFRDYDQAWIWLFTSEPPEDTRPTSPTHPTYGTI